MLFTATSSNWGNSTSSTGIKCVNSLFSNWVLAKQHVFCPNSRKVSRKCFSKFVFNFTKIACHGWFQTKLSKTFAHVKSLTLKASAPLLHMLALDQWFPNFFSSHTICGTHTVTTCHLAPGKLNIPNIIRLSSLISSLANRN